MGFTLQAKYLEKLTNLDKYGTTRKIKEKTSISEMDAYD